MLSIMSFLLITSLLGSGQEKPSKFKASTELVQVSVSALNREGQVATGLTKQDFEISEDGVKQDILECISETSPVSIALVLDKSRSMRTNLPLVVKGAENVLDSHLKNEDEFLVVVFDNTPEVLSPQFSGNADAVKHEISSHLVEAHGLTSLFDALAGVFGTFDDRFVGPLDGVLGAVGGFDDEGLGAFVNALDDSAEHVGDILREGALEANGKYECY